MSTGQSPHLAQIPEAVRIAASIDPSVRPELKQEAITYLSNVKERCEETWQDCLALYLQGAGAPGPSSQGKDGKQKLDTELRMYCEQVVDAVLIHKAAALSPDAQQSIYRALIDFVQTEWVDGPCEGNQTYLRNKLSFTIVHLFLNAYPSNVPSFLQPFFELLQPPDPSSSRTSGLNPILLAVHLLHDIALEVHDTTMRSARNWSDQRQMRDGLIRDYVRQSGDERIAVESLLRLAEKGLSVIETGGADQAKWLEVAELAVKTIAGWTPWVDLATSLTPDTLAFYQRLLRQNVVSLRIAAASVLRTFVVKGNKDPAARLQILRALDIVGTIDPLETSTRSDDDEDIVQFRVSLGTLLAAYGGELVDFADDDEIPETHRLDAESMMAEGFPLLLRFISDKQAEVTLSAIQFSGDVLRIWKKFYIAPKAIPPRINSKVAQEAAPVALRQLPEDQRRFLASLLDVCVRRLAWPDDAEWEAPTGEDPDVDDEAAAMRLMRTSCRSTIESIAAIDRNLHTEVVANIVATTLAAVQRQGAAAIPWQQAELDMHLVYTFGELTKNNTRAAFYELPPDVASKSKVVRRDSSSSLAGDAAMASGRTTPTQMNGDANPIKEKVDYAQYPLTPLGRLLALCETSGIVNHPHPSVTLQYFEIAVRYVEFWKSRPASIHPMLSAMINGRGIHHSDVFVRRRSFYLFARFVSSCKNELELDVVPAILDSIRDMMTVEAKLPKPDMPDDDVLTKATTGKTYFSDQLYLFEAAGNLVYKTKADAARQMSLLEAIAGPLMSGVGSGLQQYRSNTADQAAVLQVHHHLMALGHFAKGFPNVSDNQVEELPYTPPFKQMTEALLQALDVMKTQRVVRDSARFAFSQFVNAIGSTVAELVPQFVGHVVTEFEPTELVDFMTFLNLLMHRLKTNTFETMDMLLLPLLSRIFSVLRSPITGTDEANTHRRLKDAYLQFFTALMNANLDGVFITERNKPQFEGVLSALLDMARDCSDRDSQRLAFGFFAKSVIAWGTSPQAADEPNVFADTAKSKMSQAVANGTAVATNQHAMSNKDRAAQALPGYETFIYQRLLPACLEVPADAKFNVKSGTPVLFEVAMLLRNTLQARGQEAIDFLSGDLLPKFGCPSEIAQQLITSLRTQQSRDFRKTFADFIKMMKS